MALNSRAHRRLSALRRLIRKFARTALAGLWTCAFIAIGGWVIVDMRSSAWHEAAAVSRNILDVSSRSISRDIELYDLSIRAIVDRGWRPEVMSLPPDLRRMIVFDSSASAKGLGRMYYIDTKGDIIDGSTGDSNGVNVSDRDYFIAQRSDPGLGLFIGKPITGRIGKERCLVLSRRLDGPDGRFSGVVVGQIKLAFLREFFKSIEQGEGGQIGLYSVDGTVYVREPMNPSDLVGDAASIAGSVAQGRYAASRGGRFMTDAAGDEPERMHTFSRIPGTDLVLDVSVASRTVLADWRSRTAWMALVMAGLVLSLLLLIVRNQRELELRRGAEREALAAKREALRLSETDALTGLANRRMYDRHMETAMSAAGTSGEGMTLAILDVDHFKRLNDTHGHAVGDTVLTAIADKLGQLTQRTGEMACRIGGEEFAVVLPGSRGASALRWAEVARAAIAGLALDPSMGGTGVTVSIGVAEATPGETATQVLARADAALYEVKRGGRNAVGMAPDPGCPALAA